MGVARLLAKGWLVFCLFAGAHALNLALQRGEAPLDGLEEIGVCVLLFAAMGLLFITGFGLSPGLGRQSLLRRIRPHHLVPGFNEIVFVAFVVLSFVNQIIVAPLYMGGGIAGAVQSTLSFFVPGQRALESALQSCSLDGGRVFSSATAWLLAIIFLASAVSRIGLSAGLIRLERMTRPSSLDPTVTAVVFGAMAIVGIQLLFVGSAYPWLACSAFTDITGAVLIGLAPLMLSYLIVAALATLRASGPEQ
jgi:hypothetical protein